MLWRARMMWQFCNFVFAFWGGSPKRDSSTCMEHSVVRSHRTSRVLRLCA